MKLIIPIIILHILLLSLVRYIAWPENLLWPYLMLHGLKLYTDIFYIYTPFYAWLLAGFMKISSISVGSLITISYLNIGLSDFLIYLISKKRLWPVLIFAPLQIFFEGNGFWPDQLLAPLFLLAFWLFRSKKYFLLGIVLGLAALTKQTASFFILSFGLIMLFQNNRLKIVGPTVVGFSLMLMVLFIWILVNQNGSAFCDETLKYILGHHVTSQLEMLWPTKQQILVVLATFGPAMITGVLRKKYSLVILMASATLGIFTRFSYFHLQPALPFAALLLAENFRLAALPYFIFLLIAGKSFSRDWRQPPRFLSAAEVQNAQQINSFVKAGDETLFIATSDHYYYLTNTLPAGHFFASSTPWNLSYPGIWQRYVQNINQYRPRYIFMGKCMWEKGVCYEAPEITAYIQSHYKKVSELSDGTGVFENNPVRL